MPARIVIHVAELSSYHYCHLETHLKLGGKQQTCWKLEQLNLPFT